MPKIITFEWPGEYDGASADFWLHAGEIRTEFKLPDGSPSDDAYLGRVATNWDAEMCGTTLAEIRRELEAG